MRRLADVISERADDLARTELAEGFSSSRP